MKAWARGAAAALGMLGIAATATFGAGCAKPKAHVAQGQSFATGNAGFDGFFEQVRDLRVESLNSVDDERATRAKLVDLLGLEPTATETLAASEVGAQAKKLAARGVQLHLDVAPELGVTSSVDRAGLDPEALDLVKAIEVAVKRSVTLSKHLGELIDHAVLLEKKRVDLRAEAPATFKADARRDDIVDELDAAAEVLTLAREGCERNAGMASKFVLDLAMALEPGSGGTKAPVAAKVPGGKGAGGKSGSKGGGKGGGLAGRGGGGAPAGPRKAAPSGGGAAPAAAAPSAAPAAPAKKAKASDDFEP